MAIAVSNVKQQASVPGPGPQGLRFVTFNVTLDTSYPTGGSTGIAVAIGAASVLFCVPQKSLGYDFDYDIPTDKLKAYQQPGAASAGPSPEVPNTTNLSANVLPMLAIIT